MDFLGKKFEASHTNGNGHNGKKQVYESAGELFRSPREAIESKIEELERQITGLLPLVGPKLRDVEAEKIKIDAEKKLEMLVKEVDRLKLMLKKLGSATSD